ncbi:somatostatin receptor type 5-like isoform X2 [Stegodyphus dumicola]|nr:somatostatin receptor type 5-like isoform X2 [Stegodyphus dumicola]
MLNASVGNTSNDVSQVLNSLNVSKDNTCFEPRLSRTIFVVVILDIVLSAVSIAGNVLVVYAVLRYRQLRSVTNVFILGLAAADLLVGLNVPYYILFYFNFRSLSCHRISCLLRYWFTIYTSGCSMLCVVGVAVDRYIAILHPLSYHRLMRTRHASAYVLAVWISMGIVSSLPLLGVGDQFDPSKECDLYYTHTKEYALAAVASVVLVTFIVTTTLYSMIFKEAWRHKRAVVALELNHKVRQETKTARMMALVMSVNFLGFLPYLIVITLRYVDGLNQERIGFFKPFVVCCYFGKSAINPVVYGWKNKDFRHAFRKILSFDKSYS